MALFNRAVEKFPNNTAVIFDDKKFAYREVDDKSNDIAAYILSKNISAGDVASILIPRCEFMPIAALGALKAGFAYQPLDSTYPPERLNFMLKDAVAKILITTKELRPLITCFEGEILFIDEIPRAEKISLPEATIFRSGTTSKAVNKVEEDFCKIFGSILQIEDVGADKRICPPKLALKLNFSTISTKIMRVGTLPLAVNKKPCGNSSRSFFVIL